MKLHFTRSNGPVDDAIDRLIEVAGDVHHSEIVREMIIAALMAGKEDDERADLKLMNKAYQQERCGFDERLGKA